MDIEEKEETFPFYRPELLQRKFDSDHSGVYICDSSMVYMMAKASSLFQESHPSYKQIYELTRQEGGHLLEPEDARQGTQPSPASHGPHA
jgi:hypothetical protein